MSDLPRYPVADLQSRKVKADLDELEARMTTDTRRAGEVCTVKRDDGPTPCWWPYCDCGEQ